MNIVIPLSIASILLASCKPAGSESKATDGSAASSVANEAAIPYPLDTCLVSGEKLGEMGAPHVIIHEGREIKFCCKSCVPKFEKEPSKYLTRLP